MKTHNGMDFYYRLFASTFRPGPIWLRAFTWRAMLPILISSVLSVPSFASADEKAPVAAKPIPRCQVEPLPYDQAAVLRDGGEIARYHFGHGLQRPFLFPIIGPSGRSLTRMGHPHDPNSHSHHNSVWISHHIVNGVDFWGDGKGRIEHRKVLRYADSDREALIEVLNAWVDPAGETLLHEERRMRFVPLEQKQWLLVIDLKFSPPPNAKTAAVTFGKTSFGPIGVRVAKTIGVHDGGGRMLNSSGGENEQGIFWQRAKWVDYSGPIAPAVIEGVTLMDHPTNPNHPPQFHVRDDGWMGASLTFEGPLTVSAEKPLTVRYGLFVHAGTPPRDQLEQQFIAFTKLADSPAAKR